MRSRSFQPRVMSSCTESELEAARALPFVDCVRVLVGMEIVGEEAVQAWADGVGAVLGLLDEF